MQMLDFRHILEDYYPEFVRHRRRTANAIGRVLNALFLQKRFKQFDQKYSGLDALDWTAINGSLPESVADVEYLDPTDFAGAVNPDQSDLWWAGWTIPGSL